MHDRFFTVHSIRAVAIECTGPSRSPNGLDLTRVLDQKSIEIFQLGSYTEPAVDENLLNTV